MAGIDLRKGAVAAVTSMAVVLLVLTACEGAHPAAPSGPAVTEGAATPSSSASLSDVEIRGCVPQCSTGIHVPGPIGPGPYTTAIFMDGHLTVTYESRWVSGEDQGVEFSSAPAGERSEGGVLFWLDILPWDPEGHVAGDVPNTVDGWVDWLRSNPIVSVTSPRHATIGQMRLPATYVDITDEPGGEKFPDLITWPNAGPNVYGIGGDWIFRLYLADVMYDDSEHLLAVAVEGTDESDLEAFLPVARQVIDTADAPIQAS